MRGQAGASAWVSTGSGRLPVQGHCATCSLSGSSSLCVFGGDGGSSRDGTDAASAQKAGVTVLNQERDGERVHISGAVRCTPVFSSV